MAPPAPTLFTSRRPGSALCVALAALLLLAAAPRGATGVAPGPVAGGALEWVLEEEGGASTAGAGEGRAAAGGRSLLSSSDATLKKLEGTVWGNLQGFGIVSPALNSGSVTDYTAEVPFEYLNITYTVETNDAGASFTYNGASGSNGATYTFNFGYTKSEQWNSVTSPYSRLNHSAVVETGTWVVTAADGVTTRSYKVALKRMDLSTDMDLAYLSLDGAENATYLSSGILHPPFQRNITNYTVEVEYDVSQVKINATVFGLQSRLKLGTGCPPEDGSCGTPYSATMTANGTLGPTINLRGTGLYTYLRAEVLSQAHIGDGNDGDSYPPYPSRLFHYINTFRRTQSSSVALTNIFLNGTNGLSNQLYTFTLAPAFSTTTGSYTATVAYQISQIYITIQAPDTTFPISAVNHTSRVKCTMGDGQVLYTMVPSSLKNLNVGSNTFTMTCVSEDGSATQNYTFAVTRTAPKTDATLSGITVSSPSIGANVNNTAGTPLTVVQYTTSGSTRTYGPSSFDPNVTDYAVLWAADNITYIGQQPYMGVAVADFIDKVRITITQGSTVSGSIEGEGTGQVVSTITRNTVAVSNGISSVPTDYNLTAGTWPVPTELKLTYLVTAEDGSTTKTYTLTVYRVAKEPSASAFITYYDFLGTPASNSPCAENISYSFSINAGRWNTAFPLAANDFSAVPATVFSPYQQSQPANGTTLHVLENVTVPEGGICYEGTCKNGFCQDSSSNLRFTSYPYDANFALKANWSKAGNLTYPCAKDVNWKKDPMLLGTTDVWATAYGQTVGGANYKKTFTAIYGNMSLPHSVLEYNNSAEAGPNSLRIDGKDIYGNPVTGTPRAYAKAELEILVCPPKTYPSPNWTAPQGFDENFTVGCRCGKLTGCATPHYGFVNVLGNGSYTVNFTYAKAGNNNVYVSGTYGGTVQGVGGTSKAGIYPTQVSVYPSILGTGSTISVPTNETFRVSFAPAWFLVIARDRFGNRISNGGEQSLISVATSPLTTATDGASPVSLIVSDIGGGTYNVSMTTFLAATYNLTLSIGGKTTVEGPWPLTVISGLLASNSTAQYPQMAQAGIENKFIVEPRDSWRNIIRSADFTCGIDPNAVVGNGTNATTTNATNVTVAPTPCIFTVQLYNTSYSQLPEAYVRPRMQTVNGKHYAIYTPPQNIADDVYLKLFLNDTSLGGFQEVAGSEGNGVLVDVIPAPANASTTSYYLNTTQAAGHLKIGYKPRDRWGNLRYYQRPSPFSAEVTDKVPPINGTAKVHSAVAKNVKYMDAQSTETIHIDTVTIVGEYVLQVYLTNDARVPVDFFPFSPANITIVPDVIGNLSVVADVPARLPVGQTSQVLVTAYDKWGNRITYGGESTAIDGRVYDPLDVNSVIESTVGDQTDGTYFIQIAPGKTGNFVMRVYFSGQKNNRLQPFSTEFTSASPADFTVEGPAIKNMGGTVGKPLEVAIMPVAGLDLQMNNETTIDGVLKPEANATANSTQIINYGFADSVGRRFFTATRTVSGYYILEVKLRTDHISASPYRLFVDGGVATNLVRKTNGTSVAVPVISPMTCNGECPAGTTAELAIDLRDDYGNVAGVAENELVVQYKLQPDGFVLSADIVRVGHGPGGAAGYRSRVLLRTAGVYGVTASLGSQGICAPSENEDVCVPDAIVKPKKADPLKSLLQGSGLVNSTAGVQTELKVIPLDSEGNPATTYHSQTELRYEVNVTNLLAIAQSEMLAQMNASVAAQQNVTVYPGVSKKEFTWSPVDNSHSALYKLTRAGTYKVTVEMVRPLWFNASTWIVSGTTTNIVVTPGAVDLTTLSITKATTFFTAGNDGDIFVQLKDSYGNVLKDNSLADLEMRLVSESLSQSTALSQMMLVYTPGTYTYTCTINVPKADMYEFRVVYDAQLSPVTAAINVTAAAADASASSASGKGLIGATAGESTTFLVHPADRFGNRRTTAGGAWVLNMQLEKRVGSGCGQTTTTALDASSATIAWSQTHLAYLVSYTVQSTGTLVTSVKVGGVDIVASTFRTTVQPGVTDPSKCVLTGPGLNGAVVGAKGFVELQARDAYDNDQVQGGEPFRAGTTPRGQSTNPPPVTVTDKGDGKYDIKYSPASVGLYQLEVYLRGANVGVAPYNSPKDITVKGTTGTVNTQTSYLTGAAVLRAEVNAAQTFRIWAVDTDGIQVNSGAWPFTVGIRPAGSPADTITLTGGNGIYDNSDGTYDATYTLPTVGSYEMVVSAYGTNVKTPAGQISWPVTITSSPGSTSAKYSALFSPLPSSVAAGTAAAGSIIAKDGANNLQCYHDGSAGDDFKVTVTDSVAGTPFGDTTMTFAYATASYDISILLTRAGTYTVALMLGSTVIGDGSTHALAVTPASLHAPSSIVDGVGLLGAEAGVEATLEVEPRDQYGNTLQPPTDFSAMCAIELSPVQTSTTLSCAASNPWTGRFSAKYKVQVAGNYTLGVKLAGAHAAQSPYTSVIVEPASTAAVEPQFLGSYNTAESGLNSNFLIHAKDAFGNLANSGGENFVVEIASTAVTARPKVVDNNNGTYTANFIAPPAGAYTAKVSIGVVKVSEYAFTVTPSPTSAALSYASGVKLSSATAGEVSEFAITPISEGGFVQPSTFTSTFDVDIAPIGQGFGVVHTDPAVYERGKYRVRYSANRVLYFSSSAIKPYQLNISVAGKQLQGSPFNIELTPAEVNASACVIFNSLGERDETKFGGVAGATVNLLVQTRDSFGNDGKFDQFAPPVEYEIGVLGRTGTPTQGVATTTKVNDLRTGRVRLSYVATKTGTYDLSMKLGGAMMGITGNPIPVTITPSTPEPSAFEARGPGVTEPALVGTDTVFFIQVKDRYGNSISDGSLATLNGAIIVEMKVRVGAATSGSQRLEDPGGLTVFYQASAPTGSWYTAGSYGVRFNTTDTGTLLTTIKVTGMSANTFIGDTLAGSPFLQEVKPRTAVSLTVSGSAVTGGALINGAVDMRLFVTLVDAYGNPAVLDSDPNTTKVPKDHIVASLNTYKGSMPATVSAITEVTPSNFSFMVSATQTGVLRMEVSLSGSSVLNFTSFVNASYAHISPVNSIAYGDGIEGIVAGQESQFTVELRTTDGRVYPATKDTYPGSCVPGVSVSTYVTVALDEVVINPTNNNGKVVDNCDGTYTVKYTPTTSGERKVEVSLGPDASNPLMPEFAEPIGAPFFLLCYSGPTTASSFTFNDGTIRTTGKAVSDQEVKIDINPVDVNGNVQDYLVAADDTMLVNVTVNKLYVMQLTAVKVKNLATKPHSYYYQASFKPQEEGTYQVDAYLQNAHTQGVPKEMGPSLILNVEAGPASPAASILSGTGLTTATTGNQASFRLDLRDTAGNRVGSGVDPAQTQTSAVVEAVLEPVGSGLSVPIRVMYSPGDKVYVGDYNTTAAGTYEIKVSLYGTRVTMPKTYLSTVVLPGAISSKHTFAQGAGVGTGGQPISAGSDSKFTIFAYDDYGNALTSGGTTFTVSMAKASFEGLGNPKWDDKKEWEQDNTYFFSPPAPTDNGDGTYESVYNIPKAGTFLVTVKRGTEAVVGSPYLLRVNPGPTSATSSSVFCDASKACGLYNVTAGARGVIFVQARDVAANVIEDSGDNFFYSVVGAGGFSDSGAMVLRGTNFPGQYEASYTTTVAGELDLKVTLGDEVVLEQSLVVLPGVVSTGACTLSGTGLPTTVAADTETLTLYARDAFGNQQTAGGETFAIDIERTGTYQARFELAVADNGDGTYTSTYNIKSTGVYNIKAVLGMAQVSAVSLTIEAGPAYLDKTYVYADGPFVAGNVHQVSFIFRDFYGNPRLTGTDFQQGQLTLNAYPAEGNPKPAVTVTPLNNTFHATGEYAGYYFIDMNITLSGALRIEYMLGGQQLVDGTTGVPYAVTVSPAAADPSACLLFGPGKAAAAMGTKALLGVTVRDRYLNPLQVAATGVVAVFTQRTANGPTATAVAGMPQTLRHTSGAVNFIEYTPPTHATRYELEVLVKVGGKAVPTNGTIAFLVEFNQAGAVPTSGNSLLTLSDGSPIDVTSSNAIQVGAAGGLVQVAVLGVDARSVGVAGTDASWVAATVAPEVPVTVTLAEDGSYLVSLNVTRAADYSLYVTGGGQGIAGNWGGSGSGIGQLEITVPAAYPSDASTAEIMSTPAKVTAGLSGAVRVRSKDRFGNNQDYVSVRGPDAYTMRLVPSDSNSGLLPVICTLGDNMDGTYDMSFVATKAGTYDVELKLSGVAVAAAQGLKVVVEHGQFYPSVSTFSPAPYTWTPVHAQAGFGIDIVVEARDQYRNLHTSGDLNLDVAVSGPEAYSATGVSLATNLDGTYTASFRPLVSGDYTVKVTESGTGNLLNGTFVVPVTAGPVSMADTELSGVGISSGVAASPMPFTVSVQDAFGNGVPGASSLVSASVMAGGVGVAAVMLSDRAGSPGVVDGLYQVVVPGAYTVELSINGTAVAGSPFSVTVVPAPAPKMLSATMGASLVDVSVAFDMTTDRGQAAGAAAGDCAALLDAATVKLLGAGPTCTWKDDSTLKVFLGSNATLAPGNMVVVKADAIVSVARNSYPAASGAVLSAPRPAPAPTVVLTGAPKIGVCDNMVLDASASFGGGGRPMTYEYGVYSSSGDAMAEAAALRAAHTKSTDAIVVVPAAALRSGVEYTFSVKVTNFLGESASADITVTKDQFPIPLVYVMGSKERTVKRGAATILQSDAALPALGCSAAAGITVGSKMSFRWMRVDGATPVFASGRDKAAYERTLDSRSLYLPPNSLQPGETYKFRVTGTLTSNTALSTTAEVTVHVAASPVEAAIVGGTTRTASSAAPVTLRMSTSDPDNSLDVSGNPTPFTYWWSCAREDGDPCFEEGTGPAAWYLGESSVTLPAGKLKAGAHRFSVKVCKEPFSEGRQITVEASVVVVASQTAASLGIAPPAGGRVSPNPRANTKLELGADLVGCAGIPANETQCATAWSLKSGQLSAGDLAGAALTGTAGDLLALDAGLLTPGQTYVFVLSGTAGPVEGLSAELSVPVNDVPSSGVVSVSLATAPVYSQLSIKAVDLRLTGWSDLDTPLTYTFYTADAAGKEMPLGGVQGTNTAGGVVLPDDAAQVVTYITDAYGAAARVATALPAGSSGRRRRSLLQDDYNEIATARVLIDDLLEPAMGLGDHTQGMQLVSLYAERFGTGDQAVHAGCSAVTGMAAHHETTLAAAREINAASVQTRPVVLQSACAHAPFARDARRLTAGAEADVLFALEDTMAAALANDLRLDAEGTSCVLEGLSGMMAVAESGCNSGGARDAEKLTALYARAEESLFVGLAGRVTGQAQLRLSSPHVETSVERQAPAEVVPPLATSVASGAAGAALAFQAGSAPAGSALVVGVLAFKGGVDPAPAAAAAAGERLVSEGTLYAVHVKPEGVDMSTLSYAALSALASAAEFDAQVGDRVPALAQWTGPVGEEVEVSAGAAGGNATAAAGNATAGAVPVASANATNATNGTAPAPPPPAPVESYWSMEHTRQTNVSGYTVVGEVTLLTNVRRLTGGTSQFGVYMVDRFPPPPPSPPPSLPPPSPPPPSPPPNPPPPSPSSEDNTTLLVIVGVSCGAGVLAIGGATFACIRMRRKRKVMTLKEKRMRGKTGTRADDFDGDQEDGTGKRYDPFHTDIQVEEVTKVQAPPPQDGDSGRQRLVLPGMDEADEDGFLWEGAKARGADGRPKAKADDVEATMV